MFFTTYSVFFYLNFHLDSRPRFREGRLGGNDKGKRMEDSEEGVFENKIYAGVSTALMGRETGAFVFVLRPKLRIVNPFILRVFGSMRSTTSSLVSCETSFADGLPCER